MAVLWASLLCCLDRVHAGGGEILDTWSGTDVKLLSSSRLLFLLYNGNKQRWERDFKKMNPYNVISQGKCLAVFMSFLAFSAQPPFVKIWLKSRCDHQLNTENDAVQNHSKSAKLLLNKYISGLGLIFTVYYCSLFKQLKRMTWSLKNLLTIVLKSRILLECTLVSELNDTFLPRRKVGKSAFFHCFLTDTLEIKPTDPGICSSQTFVTLLTVVSQSPVTFHPSPSNSNWD